MKRSILCGIVLFVIFGISSIFLSCGSPDGNGTSRQSDATEMLSSVGDLSLNLPKTLKSGTVSKENIDYDGLPDVQSQAHFYLTMMVEGIEGHMARINDDINLLETDFIPGSGLEPGEVHSETFESGDSIKVKYDFQTDASGVEYLIITMATFSEAGAVKDGVYIEATEAEDGTISGHGQYMITGDNGNHYSKLVFNSASDIMTAYTNMTSEAEGLELGTLRVGKDTADTENGVYVASKWNTDLHGNHTQIAWANDSYGGVVSEDIHSDGTEDHPSMYTEYFALSEEEAKIIYRQHGEENTDILWEFIKMAKEDIVTITDEGKNGYTEGVEAPLFLALTYTEGEDGWEMYEWDGVDSQVTGDPLATNTTHPASTVAELYWIDPDDTTSQPQPGDALYKWVYFPDGSSTNTAVFEKVSEVPAAVTGLMSDINYYIQDLYPLKWVQGSMESGNTLIQRSLDIDSDGDGTNDEYRYWLDNNDDGAYDLMSDVEIMVWSYPETYYDEATETMVTTESSPWLIGDVPQTGAIDLEYIWSGAFDAVELKLQDMSEDDVISTIEVPAFPVLGEDWKDVSAVDFTEAE
ncbi:MAG: hypothetical protein ACLFST_03085 [Spirochaetia bacterium]